MAGIRVSLRQFQPPLEQWRDMGLELSRTKMFSTGLAGRASGQRRTSPTVFLWLLDRLRQGNSSIERERSVGAESCVNTSVQLLCV